MGIITFYIHFEYLLTKSDIIVIFYYILLFSIFLIALSFVKAHTISLCYDNSYKIAGNALLIWRSHKKTKTFVP